jgi:hypothetical protein
LLDMEGIVPFGPDVVQARGGDDHSGHVLLCYAGAWSLLALDFSVPSLFPPLSHLFCSFCSFALSILPSVSWVTPLGLFLCQLFGLFCLIPFDLFPPLSTVV